MPEISGETSRRTRLSPLAREPKRPNFYPPYAVLPGGRECETPTTHRENIKFDAKFPRENIAGVA